MLFLELDPPLYWIFFFFSGLDGGLNSNLIIEYFFNVIGFHNDPELLFLSFTLTHSDIMYTSYIELIYSTIALGLQLHLLNLNHSTEVNLAKLKKNR